MFSSHILSCWEKMFCFLYVFEIEISIFNNFSKPLPVSDPVLETLIFSKNPVLGRKNPFKLYPYKLNCVYLNLMIKEFISIELN